MVGVISSRVDARGVETSDRSSSQRKSWSLAYLLRERASVMSWKDLRIAFCRRPTHRHG